MGNWLAPFLSTGLALIALRAGASGVGTTGMGRCREARNPDFWTTNGFLNG